jgi:hypothetical protein
MGELRFKAFEISRFKNLRVSSFDFEGFVERCRSVLQEEETVVLFASV